MTITDPATIDLEPYKVRCAEVGQYHPAWLKAFRQDSLSLIVTVEALQAREAELEQQNFNNVLNWQTRTEAAEACVAELAEAMTGLLQHVVYEPERNEYTISAVAAAHRALAKLDALDKESTSYEPPT